MLPLLQLHRLRCALLLPASSSRERREPTISLRALGRHGGVCLVMQLFTEPPSRTSSEEHTQARYGSRYEVEMHLDLRVDLRESVVEVEVFGRKDFSQGD